MSGPSEKPSGTETLDIRIVQLDLFRRPSGTFTMTAGRRSTELDVVWKDADGTVREFFQFNDRGRGPKTYTMYRLNEDGIVTAEKTTGVNYMKSAVEENFALSPGEMEER